MLCMLWGQHGTESVVIPAFPASFLPRVRGKPQLNNIRVAHTWLDPAVVGSTATGIPMMTWASPTTTFLCTQGLHTHCTTYFPSFLPRAHRHPPIRSSAPSFSVQRPVLLVCPVAHVVLAVRCISVRGFSLAL